MIGADRKQALLVGGFVVVVVGLALLILIFLGTLTRWLQHRTALLVHLPDVSGLRQGAAVQLAGVEVGTVANIELAPPSSDGAQVKLSVRRKALDRLHADASVMLATAGLLGDKLVRLDPGHAPRPLSPGVVLEGHVQATPEEVIAEADQAIREIHRLTAQAAQVVTPELAANLAATAQALRRFAERTDRGPGLMHDLVYGREMAGQARRSTTELARAAHSLSRAAATTDQIVTHVRSARGTLGGLVYDPMVYQNLREITGNVRRSVLLRTLVRFALKHEEVSPPAKARQLHEGDPFGPTPLDPAR